MKQLKASLTTAHVASTADQEQILNLQAELTTTKAEVAQHAQQLQGVHGRGMEHAQHAGQVQRAHDDLLQQLQAAKNEMA